MSMTVVSDLHYKWNFSPEEEVLPRYHAHNGGWYRDSHNEAQEMEFDNGYVIEYVPVVSDTRVRWVWNALDPEGCQILTGGVFFANALAAIHRHAKENA